MFLEEFIFLWMSQSSFSSYLTMKESGKRKKNEINNNDIDNLTDDINNLELRKKKNRGLMYEIDELNEKLLRKNEYIYSLFRQIDNMKISKNELMTKNKNLLYLNNELTNELNMIRKEVDQLKRRFHRLEKFEK